jgi:hypothetical protein
MFGKFGKKKTEEKIESKSKQKNDLFTLLEESPKKTVEKTTFADKAKSPTIPKSDYTPTAEETQNSTAEKPIKKTEVKKEIKKTTAESKASEKPVSSTDQLKAPLPESSIKGDKSQLLLLEIEKLPDRAIKPVVDFNENSLFYPILAKIGESPENIDFLDDLVTEGVLNKEVYEKLIICPNHPDAYSSSVRLYCPKCNSLNVDKLNLYEHKRCGFITESTEFDFSNPKNSTCPSCKKKIIDYKKEIRVPAMWHQCIDCEEKFDNAIIKLYCRQHEHDFETNSGQFVTTYAYKLKDYEAPLTSDDDKMHDDLASLLSDFNFTTEFKASVKGKSGNSHKIPIYAKNNASGEEITIFVVKKAENLDQSDINSILIPILDIGPKNILLLTSSAVGEGVSPLAKQYGIEIMSDPDLSRIIQHIDEFVSERYSRNGEK